MSVLMYFRCGNYIRRSQPTARCLWAVFDWLGALKRSGQQAVYCKGPFKEHDHSVPLAFISSYVLEIIAVSMIPQLQCSEYNRSKRTQFK